MARPRGRPVVLDTGALIALEKRDRRMDALYSVRLLLTHQIDIYRVGKKHPKMAKIPDGLVNPAFW